MQSEQTLVSGIEHKVRKLIENNISLTKKNEELQHRLSELENRISMTEGELDQKNSEIFKYTLANSLEKELGVEEGKERIDKLIEEIDKCIEVLSD